MPITHVDFRYQPDNARVRINALIDKATDQIMIETKFVEVFDQDLRETINPILARGNIRTASLERGEDLCSFDMLRIALVVENLCKGDHVGGVQPNDPKPKIF